MSEMFVPKVPAQTTEEIKGFCSTIVADQLPYYVKVRPVPDAVPNNCHMNVKQHIDEYGGTSMSGWIDWQSPLLLQAEFHTNWISPDGEIVDITPKEEGESRILFLPDQRQKWPGRFVPGHYKARRLLPNLDKLIRIHRQTDEIRAKYRPMEKYTPLDALRRRRLDVEIDRLVIAVYVAIRRERHSADQSTPKKIERKRRKQQRRRRR
ncbi:hypothetical protein [Planctomicrobium sp. SH527]|uniref:hypothetical protein n=1 Tax=Planctomicrobium sp. SH527 TaxID=3448123 RepID=UPI003F5C925F